MKESLFDQPCDLVEILRDAEERIGDFDVFFGWGERRWMICYIGREKYELYRREDMAWVPMGEPKKSVFDFQSIIENHDV